jgi:hypothetical protein
MRPVEPEIDVAILADGAVVHVDLHELQLFADALAVAHAEIERRADDDQHVRLGKGLAAGAIEVMRIAGRQEPAARAVEVAGNIEAAQERNRLVMTPRRPNLLTVENRRTLGVHQNVGQFLDIARVSHRVGRGTVLARLRDDRLGEINLPIEHVARNLQIYGSRSTVERLAGGHGNHVGDAFGARNGCGELGDRRHQVDVRQVLQRSHLVLGERALSADVQNWALGAERRGDPGHRVGAAGTCRGDHATELAGLPGVAVRGVRRDLLVPHVDDADALVDAAVVDVDDMAAAEREDRIHALVLESFRHEVTTRDHACVPALALQGVLGGRRPRLDRCGICGCHRSSNLKIYKPMQQRPQLEQRAVH